MQCAIDEGMEILVSDLLEIERYSVNVRYPGISADKEEAKSAYHGATIVRTFLLQKLEMR